MDRRTLVIEIRKGGLGDHLFYSPLPRIAKQTGAFDRVFISNRSTVRHSGYRKLVWEMNPFVDGFTDANGVFRFSTYHDESQNMLDSIMLLYGLDDGMRFHEPEVSYTPGNDPDLAGVNIYDPNYQSGTGNLISGQLMENYFREQGIVIHYQMKDLGKAYLPIRLDRYYGCANLFEFCDLIASANHVFCLNTGTATLAAALNKPLTVFYGNGHVAGYRHSRRHRYVCLGSDYEPRHHVAKWARETYRFLLKIPRWETLLPARFKPALPVPSADRSSIVTSTVSTSRDDP